jgi:hypothetical protein
VTSLDSEILTLGQLYRDRADCENVFDELKNQWGWGGFTTQDLTRCRLLAGMVALIYDWWSLFVRLADPEHHREAITNRPLLLSAIARRTQHAGQVTLTVSSTHGMQHKARRAYIRIAGFLAELRKTAEQLDALQRWYRILSEALRYFLKVIAHPTPGTGLVGSFVASTKRRTSSTEARLAFAVLTRERKAA